MEIKKQKGGLAVGPSHANGGIPGIIKSTGEPIEFEGGEIIITKKASEKHCETLSKINQDGGGVAIPCGESSTETKFESGGKTKENGEIKYITNKEVQENPEKFKIIKSFDAKFAQGFGVQNGKPYVNRVDMRSGYREYEDYPISDESGKRIRYVMMLADKNDNSRYIILSYDGYIRLTNPEWWAKIKEYKANTHESQILIWELLPQSEKDSFLTELIRNPDNYDRTGRFAIDKALKDTPFDKLGNLSSEFYEKFTKRNFGEKRTSLSSIIAFEANKISDKINYTPPKEFGVSNYSTAREHKNDEFYEAFNKAITSGQENAFESGGKTPYAPDYLQRIFDARMKVEKEKDRLNQQIAEAMARQDFGKAASMRRKVESMAHKFECDADATAFEYYRHLCGIHSDVLVSHGEGFISYKYGGAETRYDGLNFKHTFEQGGKVSGWEMPSAEIYKYAVSIKKKHPELWAAGGNIYGNQAFENLGKVIERGYWLKQEEPFYKKWQSFKARHAGNFRLAGVIANLKWLSWGEIGEKQAKQTIEEEL